jgi:predicted cobalt transporter CbtA
LEQETDHERRRADRYDLGEVFLEIALVITSITLLSGRRIFWHAGILLGVAGFVVAGSAIWLH